MSMDFDDNIRRSPSEIWQEAAGLKPDVPDAKPSARKDIDALQTYINDIGDMPSLSQEEQEGMIAGMLAADDGFRAAVGVFGVVIPECINQIENSSEDDELEELFLPSGVREPGGIRRAAMTLKRELAAFHREWHDAFVSDPGEMPDYRRRAVELLDQMPFTADLVENCWQLVSSYRNFATGGKSGMRAFIEDKMMMSMEEYASALNAANAARERLHEFRRLLLEANLRLVVKVSLQYKSQGMSRSDMIQEGNIGLMRALEKFDFRLGHRFSTYAIWWIRQSISRAISEQGAIIRLPGHIINTIRAINRAEQRFILENGREPVVEDLARMLEMPAPRISAIRKMARQTISLQAPIKAGEGASIEDFIADERGNDSHVELPERVLREKIREALKTLPERDQQIIILRFGLFDQPVQTLEEISRRLGLTRERVRQLETRILGKLRNPEAMKILAGVMRH